MYLVGAGPGDPGLLTVRGAQVLAGADVVVYDRLSVASLLELAPDDAELVNVGKAPGNIVMSQDDINDLLVRRGRTGGQIVRLKGGDPFVFARGGEEAQALVDAGVDFEVVPGISSAIAVPAYAGIPLTLRHSSTLFTVITGHEDPDKGGGPDGEIDWEAVARLGGTLVILMGVAPLERIAARLIAGGLDPDTPAAAVRWGTRPEQRTVRATLATLADHDLEPPSTIVVGKVAAMDLAWFETRPLFGRKVVVTRPRAQAGPMRDHLRAMGAEPVEVPVIEIVDPLDGGAALAAALAAVATYDWVVVTSANGAHAAAGRPAATPVTSGGCGSPRSDQGPPTRSSRGTSVPISCPPASSPKACSMPSPRRPRATAAGCCSFGPRWPATCCRTGCAEPDGTSMSSRPTGPCRPSRPTASRELVRAADAVTFTSSSTVEQFVAAFGTDAVPALVASIGPVTSATAGSLGLTVDVEAGEHTTAGLVAALVDHVRGAS